MAKDPAVLFYTSDFLTGTSRLTDEQVGQYIRALCSQHQEGRFLKDELYQILKSYDSPVWKKFKIDENGFYYNERMNDEIEKRLNYCNSKSHKGISGRKKKSYDNHMEIIRKSSENHTENGNENDNINSNENIKEENWRTSIEIYLKEITEEYNKFINDNKWIELNKHLYPGIDIKKSIEKGFKNFWGTEAGWKHYKKKKIEKPNYKSTFINSIDLNKVYFPRQQHQVETFTPDYHKPYVPKKYNEDDENCKDEIENITKDLTNIFGV